jgi:acyl-CoA dehydrogenase
MSISTELLDLRQAVETFLDRVVRPAEEAHLAELLRTGTLPAEVQLRERRRLRRLSADAGFYGMALPEEVGGQGVGHLATALCHEAIGASGLFLAERGGVLPNAEGPSPSMLVMNEAQRDRYLRPLVRAEREGCFALTEAVAGSDATAIHTTARPDGDHWLINGTKQFITHGQYADFAQVVAVTDRSLGHRGGITIFLVDMDTPGVEVARVEKTLSSDIPAEIRFTDVRVHSEQVMGEVGFGFSAAMKSINKGRIDLAAWALGKAVYCLERMLTYAKERTTFGRPIGARQFVQAAIVDSDLEIEMVRGLVYRAATATDEGHPDARRLAAGAKIAATETLGRVADRAIQIHGGLGVMTEAGLERIYRDARPMRIYDGANDVLRSNIATWRGLPAD